ncbi:glycoside hydrolase family 3 N-terminal domain-containing protein [Cereibacter sphaeroides]|uniref:glycoside hydrolase family 3 N-terminal domain-containing protein n=1 Tax=Cereibacter sphaeroides TaxID=1063 RepID=UPI001F3137A1|nr:glycoside hydrolase family 3 N-terminal domain-containing protein [Cereibacter sphaeroides]MCE6968399.1 glycoside hydrolase family 3 C-terminal domain-containing protein [Cereibacter sphaeroides]
MPDPATPAPFLDDLLARMTLREKIGQLNYPHAEGLPTTGAAEGADTETLIRQGDLCGTSAGRGAADRRRLQRLAVEEGPNGIPLFFARDCLQRYATGAPIPLAQSCSWDPGLVARIAAMTAREARADGVTLNWAPMLDISHDARWGRIAEGHGELPWLCARLAEAVVRGYQGEDGDLARPDRVMATLKHFAGYGLAAAGRDYATVEASPATLMRIMEPFRAGIAAGAGAVMVAFSALNDVPATANAVLLRDVLRRRFGFTGIVVTDFTAIDPELVNHGIAADVREAAYLAFKAGVTIDLVSGAFLRHLAPLVTEGQAAPDARPLGPVTEAEITARCRLVLEAKARLGLFDDPWLGLDEDRRARMIRAPEHVALAREAAAKSLVLLKNAGVLPLARGGRLALIGPLADDRVDLQGTWAIDVDPSNSVTLLEGMRRVGHPTRILHARGCNLVDDPNLAARLNMHNCQMPSVILDPRPADILLAEARAVAHEADAIVLCLGEAKEHAGESSTRLDIGLPGAQAGLVEAMAAVAQESGKPLILVVMAGRPLALTREAAVADALIWTGHPGAEGGNAIADVLFGDAAPYGRLSLALPRHVGQLPLCTEELPTGRPHEGIGVDVPGDTEVDASGRRVFRKFTTACILEGPHSPLFPAGFGLTYTSFAHGPLRASARTLQGADAVLEVAAPVTNTGARWGTEVVQLYLRDPVARISRPVRELRGFRRLTLAPGETAEAVFRITVDDLSYDHGPALEAMVRGWDPGEFLVMVGPNAGELQSLTVRWDA